MSEWITARDLVGQFESEVRAAGEGDVWTVTFELSEVMQRDLDNQWPNVLPALGFQGNPLEEYAAGTDTEGGTITGYRMSAAARAFIVDLERRGIDLVAYRPDWQSRHKTYAIRMPDGRIVGNYTIDTGNDIADFFRQFVIPVFGIAGGFGFLGSQIAAATGLPGVAAEGIARVAVTAASGGDVDRALIGVVAPIVARELVPSSDLFPSTDLDIDPALLGPEVVTMDPFDLPVDYDFNFDPYTFDLPVFDIPDLGDITTPPMVTCMALTPECGYNVPDPVMIEPLTPDVVADLGIEGRDFATLPVSSVAPPTASEWTITGVIQDATAAMLAAAGLVAAYRQLTGGSKVNTTAAARTPQGANVQARDDGLIWTRDEQGRVTSSRPAVGLLQTTTTGRGIINNGDGTYTLIGADGQSQVVRYAGAGAGIMAGLPAWAPWALVGGAALLLVARSRT